MNIRLAVSAVVVLAVGILVGYHLHSRRATAPLGPLVHVKNDFQFVAHGPYQAVAPLFGAQGERAWGGKDWDPQFLYPQPARDVEGAVFTVAHSHHHSTWINTAFDLDAGHVQYAYVIPDAQAVLIDIHLHAQDANSTDVKVSYERTALASDFNEHVARQGEHDRNSGPEWQRDIDGYLKSK